MARQAGITPMTMECGKPMTIGFRACAHGPEITDDLLYANAPSGETRKWPLTEYRGDQSPGCARPDGSNARDQGHGDSPLGRM
jgi:hypothetical protein